MRNSGLPTVGTIPSPMHIVHLYHHGQELLDLCAEFCCAGLDEGDCCIWVTAPPWTVSLALYQLTLHHASAPTAVNNGQMRFVSHQDWHASGPDMGHPEGLLKNATLKISEAHQQGSRRIRVCGNAAEPLFDMDWTTRLRYEAALHQLILSSDLLVLCSYRLRGLAEEIRNGLLRSHHAMITLDSDRWLYAPTSRES